LSNFSTFDQRPCPSMANAGKVRPATGNLSKGKLHGQLLRKKSGVQSLEAGVRCLKSSPVFILVRA
jgi:hypothetical protein